jgi:hypothetical protein
MSPKSQQTYWADLLLNEKSESELLTQKSLCKFHSPEPFPSCCVARYEMIASSDLTLSSPAMPFLYTHCFEGQANRGLSAEEFKKKYPTLVTDELAEASQAGGTRYGPAY